MPGLRFKPLHLGRSPWPLWLVILAATGWGLGLSPFASGTIGALPGVGIVWLAACAGVVGLKDQVVFAAALMLLAVPICHLAEHHFGRKDDGRIVADEYLTFPIGLIGLPLIPWVVVMAFVTNRVFDILKPPPANRFQRLPGGLGIVLDDAVSAFYSLLVNHFVVWVVGYV